MILFRFLIASTCIEEMFMSGNIRRVCCLAVKLSSSLDIYDTSCYSALVVLVLYYCQSVLSFELSLRDWWSYYSRVSFSFL